MRVQCASASCLAHRPIHQRAVQNILNLLGERSQANKYMRYIMGLYLYSTGASRQQITVSNHLGYSIGYATLAGHRKQGHFRAVLDTSDGAGEEPPKVKWKLGVLGTLSEAMLDEARSLAAKGEFVMVYDNINMVWKAAEQIIGRTGEYKNRKDIVCFSQM